MNTPIEKITLHVMDLDKETAFYTKDMGMKGVERTVDFVMFNDLTMDLLKGTTRSTKEIYHGMDQFDLIIKPRAYFVSKDGYHSPFGILRIYP